MADEANVPSDEGSLIDFYADIGKRGLRALRNDRADVSPYLDDLEQDTRLGLTLIARPSPEAARAMEDILARLDRAAPDGLFCYNRPRFHFTVLSLIDARPEFEANEHVVQLYEQEISAVIGEFVPFDVEFRGICATPKGDTGRANAIIAKGYPVGAKLADLRNALRRRLKPIGMGHDIDRRYRIRGAHITLARFRRDHGYARLADALDGLVESPIGSMTVTEAQLVCNDFYMTPGKVRTFARIPSPAVPMIHNVPAPDSGVVGRQAELRSMMRAVTGTSAKVAVILGFGGVGKSELAKMLGGALVAAGHPFRFVCWIDLRSYAGSRVTFPAVLDRIALAANPASKVPSMDRLEDKEHHVRAALKAQPSLVIFDNYEDLSADRNEEELIANFVGSLPCGSAAGSDEDFIRVVVTTRALQSLELAKVSRETIELGELPWEDARKLMASLMRVQGNPLDPGQQRLVYDSVYGVPKLIILAMAQLRKTTFGHWFRAVDGFRGAVEALRGKAVDEIVNALADALFGHAWKHLLSQDMKRLLMALPHFGGEARPNAWQATAGVSPDSFWREIVFAAEAYIKSGDSGAGYSAHPLAMQFYRSKLEADRDFYVDSAMRFVGCFTDLAAKAGEERDLDWMGGELANASAAARLADALAKQVEQGQASSVRSELVRLVDCMRDFLWLRGCWRDFEEMVELAAAAAGDLGERHARAHLLCDLAWVVLRKEELDRTEDYIQTGLELFREIDDRQGIALMTRHLGKAALVRGLDKTCYEPGDDWPKWYPLALDRYTESLALWQSLQDAGEEQREAIADLKLDLGRLYWLDGQHAEGGVAKDSAASAGGREQAAERYRRSHLVSREACAIFRDLEGTPRQRGTAKAWGNCGNAARQMAGLLAAQGQAGPSRQWLKRAEAYYTRSLELAAAISRPDEIAHAYWGLAEAFHIRAALDKRDHRRTGVRLLLELAQRYVTESHELYESLAGPRDLNSTKRLRQTIEGELTDLA